MDGRFLTAFVIPEKWDILGYRLKPFTLEHSLSLTVIDSPFLNGKVENAKPEDVLVFLRICSSEHPSKAFRKPTIMDYWRIARMEADLLHLFDAIKQIMEYIEICCSTPKFYSKQNEKGIEVKKEGIPLPLILATNLMSKLGMSKHEAWSTTVGQAVWYITTYSINEGADIKVLTTDDEQKAESDLDFLKKLNEELAKNKKGKK
jgi:hypothetical protein